MSKAHSLFSVLADNALSMFPVDQERYELLNAVETYYVSGLCLSGLGYYHRDPRIRNHLLELTDTIQRHVDAYFLPMSRLEMDPLSRMRKDVVIDADYDVTSEYSLFGDPEDRNITTLLMWRGLLATWRRHDAFICDRVR